MELLWTITLICVRVTIEVCERYGLPMRPCGDYVFAGAMINVFMKLATGRLR